MNYYRAVSKKSKNCGTVSSLFVYDEETIDRKIAGFNDLHKGASIKLSFKKVKVDSPEVEEIFHDHYGYATISSMLKRVTYLEGRRDNA